MSEFSGYVFLGDTFLGALQVTDTSFSPINADALPTFRVYGPDGFVENGTCAFKDSASVTSATNASPISISSSGHGITTGARITITGVTGNSAANGTFTATRVDDNSFTLDGSTGNGSYISGGTWNKTGLYQYTINALGASGYETGETYHPTFDYAISSTTKADVHSIIVS